jgi:hypothetical protein
MTAHVPLTDVAEYAYAASLAATVMRAWHDRGFANVSAIVAKDERPIGKGGHIAGVYGIKSNLVNGLPPGTTPVQVSQAFARRRAGRG